MLWWIGFWSLATAFALIGYFVRMCVEWVNDALPSRRMRIARSNRAQFDEAYRGESPVQWEKKTGARNPNVVDWTGQ